MYFYYKMISLKCSTIFSNFLYNFSRKFNPLCRREKLSYSKRRRGGNVGKCVKLREEANAFAVSFSVCLHRHIKCDKLGGLPLLLLGLRHKGSQRLTISAKKNFKRYSFISLFLKIV